MRVIRNEAAITGLFSLVLEQEELVCRGINYWSSLSGFSFWGCFLTLSVWSSTSLTCSWLLCQRADQLLKDQSRCCAVQGHQRATRCPRSKLPVSNSASANVSPWVSSPRVSAATPRAEALTRDQAVLAITSRQTQEEL